MLFALVVLAFAGVMIAAMWSLFEKAGEAGWKAIVPIYSAFVLARLCERPWWWVVAMCVPVVGLIPATILCWDLARVFGKSGGWGLGIALLPFVFLPMLAFGDARYQGDGGPAMKRAA